MAKYRWRTRPYAHQVRAVKFALRQFKQGLGVAFLMEPRTGKTKSTIDTLSILHKTVGLRKVLIVAPNRVLGTWVQEFAVHCPLTYQTIVWDKEARQQKLPPDNPMYDLQVIICNYEAFGQPGRKTKSGRRSRANGRFKHRKLLQDWIKGDDAAAVLDEGHKIKSPSGKAANMLVSMVPMFRYRFLLTGTPVTKAKRAHDIFMQWQWVNPKRFEEWGSTVSDFRNHTGRWISSNGFPQWAGARTEGMEDMRQGIHTDGIVVARADCFDLPPRQDRVMPVELGPSAKHYDEMAREMVTRLESGDIAEASIPLVVTLRLLQLTSGFVGVQDIIHVRGVPKAITRPERVGFEKLDKLEELLTEETIERDEKVVIAARFKPDMDAIASLCDALKIPHWSIRGKVKREDSDRAIQEFRRYDKGAAAIIVQPQAASLGIDLSSASEMIWYSLTPSWVDFTQACDRIALSKVSTRFTYLLVPDSVDTLSYNTLREDGNVSRAIMARPEVLLRRR